MVARIYTSNDTAKPVLKTALSALLLSTGQRRDHLQSYSMSDKGMTFTLDADDTLSTKALVFRDEQALNTLESF